MSEPVSRVPMPPFSHYMGWGAKYAKEQDVVKYAQQRDAEHSAYNASKDKSTREQCQRLRDYIEDLKKEKSTLQQENEKLQAELQAEKRNGKRPRSDEDDAGDSQEQKRRRQEFMKRVLDDAWEKVSKSGDF